ncbi:MAG: Wzz/FepE/Etk N-terminal domain-containing protein [Actinomycetota bacterium]|nr:Wzz/FepE/Etk N-terminal domain-containing protein [Actinomycetota bacterium]
MHDYQRLLSRHKFTLLAASIIGAAVAFAYSATVTPRYNATAAIQFQDITTQEGLVGTAAATLETPAALSAGSLLNVTDATVLGAARRTLGTNLTMTQLRNAVSPSVDANSNFVDVQASATSGSFAARLANAVARATVDQTNQQQRAIFQADAVTLSRRIATIRDNPANLTTRQNDQATLSRLQTLGIVARPAAIATTAQTPSSPASPKQAFDTILGGILGLIVGLGIGYVRESRDRRLHTPGDIAEEVEGLPVLGLISDSVLGGAPLLSPNHDAETRVAVANFGILRRNVELLNLEGRSLKLVAVTSPAPEEGKTTVALSLACAFASVGRHTILVEADLRRPTLGDRLGLERTPGLSEYLAGNAEPTDILHLVPLLGRPSPSTNGRPDSLVTILAGEVVPNPDELLASSRFSDALAELAEAYDVVVIDTAPLLPVPDTLEILPLVDAYLICIREGRTTSTDVSALRTLLRRLPPKPSGCVTTGVPQRDYKASGYYDYYTQHVAGDSQADTVVG